MIHTYLGKDEEYCYFDNGIFIIGFPISECIDGDGARFPSALIGIGVEPPKNLKGIILEVK